MNQRNGLNRAIVLALTLATLTVIGCRRAQPPAAIYTPSFSYQAAAKGEKIDVTVGLIAPQFSADGATWWQYAKQEDTSRALVSSLKSSFEALLIDKGFYVTGPFESVDAMTFPEKKGSDFVLYPDLDIQVTASVQPETINMSGPSCVVRISAGGNVQIVVKEPLSGEKMWIKRLEVSLPPKDVPLEGMDCIQQLKASKFNEWKKAHVEVFAVVMQALDSYVNGEEFQGLKQQAAELRAKKVY